MRSIGRGDNLTDKEIYNEHAYLWVKCADEILLRQGRKFVIDDNNRDQLHFLLLYFNGCDKALNPDEYKDERFKQKVSTFDLEKNILLCGGVGSGKTLIMDTFSLYLKRTRNPLYFKTTSVTEMLNYYKVNEHLDYYTFNMGKECAEPHPLSFCLNDVGVDTQKHYGQDLSAIIEEYLHARYEIYTQMWSRNHLTTNLKKETLESIFDDGFKRLSDRFKSYNIIPLLGNSRR